ncbi:lactate utilization protein C [Halalkalibaculum sp. DA3122]|uniref:LutC/YkgG family protein n=1 Tax=unclassified Halalkalibaculum TaxID=2964617 RepID=UPI00375462A9
MSDGREEILNRVRTALSGVPEDEEPGDIPVPREYRRKGSLDDAQLTDLFAERTGEYKATIQRVEEKDLQSVISAACQKEKVERLVVPAQFPERWLPADLELLHDEVDQPLSHRQLDESDGVVTTCALAVAETGTIILDAGPGQGRRALTLLPDYHLCIVREDQIVEVVPEAFERFNEKIQQDGPPLTFISGPSATSDIELNRVEGVHGPRRLEVLIASK